MVVLLYKILSILFFFLLFFLSFPFYIFRWILSRLVPLLRPGYGSILSTHSALFAIPDIENTPSMNILIGMEMKGPLYYEDVVNLISSRMVYLKDSHDKLLYPEFQQYTVTCLGYPFWKLEKNFNIRDHINVSKSLTVNEDSFAEGNNFLEIGFKGDKSPWEILILPKQGGYTLLFKFHHSLADGNSIFQALIRCCDSPTEIIKPNALNNTVSTKYNYSKALSLFCSFIPVIYGIFFNRRKTNNTNFEIPISKMTPNRVYSISQKISMENIKTLSKNNNISVSTVLLAGISGAMRNHFLNTGRNCYEDFGCVVPVPVKDHPLGLTNSLAFANFSFDLTLPNFHDRALKIDKSIKNVKESMSCEVTFALCTLMGGLPSLIRQFIPLKFQPLSCNIFPGPKEPMTFGGSPLVDMYFVINSAGTHPCTIGLFSYSGNFRIAASFDGNLCSDTIQAQKFTQNLYEELQNITMKSYSDTFILDIPNNIDT